MGEHLQRTTDQRARHESGLRKAGTAVALTDGKELNLDAGRADRVDLRRDEGLAVTGRSEKDVRHTQPLVAHGLAVECAADLHPPRYVGTRSPVEGW